jgi:hypothetical protein
MIDAYLIAPLSDRDAFGHWLSGFVDGEGHFGLGFQSKNTLTPKARFSIMLRADDRAILEAIRDYWDCGKLCRVAARERSNATMTFSVRAAQQLANIIVPHFERYPLRAKKARDFVLWRQGVLMVAKISARRQRWVGRRSGTVKWTKAERNDFAAIATSLKHQREFESTTVDIPPARTEAPSLFD